MSNFVQKKGNGREVMLYHFDSKKSAAKSFRMLNRPTSTMPHQKELAVSRFSEGQFGLRDQKRENRPKRFEDTELQALLDENNTQPKKCSPCNWMFLARPFSNACMPWKRFRRSGNGCSTNWTKGSRNDVATPAKCCSYETKDCVFCIELLLATISGYFSRIPSAWIRGLTGSLRNKQCCVFGRMRSVSSTTSC